jgi:hypothetical protein
MCLGDVSLHLGCEVVVGLTAHDEPVALVREYLGHRSPFDRWGAMVAFGAFPNLSPTFS